MPDAIKRWRPAVVRGVRPAKEVAHYRTADWLARRQRILVRDANTCRDCSMVVAGKDAHVDHIVPLELGGTDADENLCCRCASCHGRKTAAERLARGLLG